MLNAQLTGLWAIGQGFGLRAWALGFGHWALGIGQWALSIEHWALGIGALGHWGIGALSIGYRALRDTSFGDGDHRMRAQRQRRPSP
jgi:hypothetical protein